MFFNVLLTELPSSITKDRKNAAKSFFASVACENADMVSMELFPVIISRYATQSEVDLYLSKANELGCVLSVQPISDSDDVFMRFENDIGLVEQKDIRKMGLDEIHRDLNDGVNTLYKFKRAKEGFLSISNKISQYATDYNNLFKITRPRSNTNHTKLNAFLAVISIIVGLIFGIFLYIAIDKLFIAILSGLLLAVLLEGILDLIVSAYKNSQVKKNTLMFEQKYHNLSEQIALLNSEKNHYFHEVEHMVDTMMSKNVLLSMNPSRRTIENANIILKDISDGQTLKHILSYL